MSRAVTITRDQLSQVPFLDADAWTPSRAITSLTFFVKNEWNSWFAANNQLHKIMMQPVEADYLGDRPARPTDQVFRLMHLNAQRVSFPEMRLAAKGIWNDFQDLGTSLAKINLFHEAFQQKKVGTGRFVETEVEFIVMVCRGIFDLLQEMILAIWDKVDLADKSVKKKGLPKSFADVVLQGDNPRPTDQIVAKYGLPHEFATWYTSQTEFFFLLRQLRNRMNHSGTRAVTMSFPTERGVAIFRHEKPWCQLYNWPKEVELQNELVPLRPAICVLIARTIEATNTFADVLESTIQLPKPLYPGLKYFSRGHSDHQLWEMSEVIKHSWWCDTHAEVPSYEEASPFEKPE